LLFFNAPNLIIIDRIPTMPDSTIESFVDEIAQRSKIDPLAAETAVGTILSVIQQWLRGRRRRSSKQLGR